MSPDIYTFSWPFPNSHAHLLGFLFLQWPPHRPFAGSYPAGPATVLGSANHSASQHDQRPHPLSASLHKLEDRFSNIRPCNSVNSTGFGADTGLDPLRSYKAFGKLASVVSCMKGVTVVPTFQHCQEDYPNYVGELIISIAPGSEYST